MPLVNTNETNPAPAPQNPNIRPKEYRGVTNDLGYLPQRALLTHIEGYPWVLEDYFSQYLNEDNGAAAQNVNRVAAVQQYMRIRNMEIVVSSPNAMNQDTTSAEVTVSGSATTYPGIIPNNGDMFLAAGYDGRKILYGIRDVTMKSMMKDTCYTFEYYVVDYDTQVRYADLMEKSIKTVIFIRDFVYTNQRPFLVDSEHEFYQKANQFLLDSQSRYLKDYTHARYKTFLIPDQPFTTYDPYLTAAVTRLIDGSVHQTKANVMIQNCDTGYPYTIETFWDGLLCANGANRDSWATSLGMLESSDFSGQPLFAGIRFSGIDCVYHALGNPQFAGTMPTEYYLEELGGGGLRAGLSKPLYQKLKTNEVIIRTILSGLSVDDPVDPPAPPRPPLIYPISSDTFYVFTKEFYAQTENQSILELQVNCALSGRKLNRVDLMTLMGASYRWSHLDRFYYLPVLWVLARISLAEM